MDLSTTENPRSEEIHETIARMLQAMEGTYQDIVAVHRALLADQDLYLAVWEQLGAPFRRHWVAYLDDYYRENGGSPELPCAD